MYNYQSVSYDRKFGGYKVVFTGVNKALTSGRYCFESTTELPDVVNGYVPAGTPLHLDDVTRKAQVHYAFQLTQAATATGTSIRVAKGMEGSRIRVGMVVMIMPTDLSDTGQGVTVNAVDRSNADYDIVTLATGGLGTAVSVGGVIVEASATGSAAVVKVKPNCLLPYDLPKEPNANLVWTDGMFNLLDGVVLENRIPPIVDAVKAHMLSEGVFVRYSKSKE